MSRNKIELIGPKTYVDLQSDRRETVGLNGEWQFRPDPKDEGKNAGWFQPEISFEQNISVPLAWVPLKLKALTGWYKRKIKLPAMTKGCRAWLKLGGVNPACEIWVNGKNIGGVKHPALQTKFAITEQLIPDGEQDITIRVYEEKANRVMGCWYNISCKWSGLWNNIELEFTQDVWVEDLCITPNIDQARAELHLTVCNNGAEEKKLALMAKICPATADVPAFAAQQIISLTARQQVEVRMEIPIRKAQLWSPDNPYLYVARVEVKEGEKILDAVDDRFGMRKIEARGNKLYLNNRPLYLRGYGDDGYYPRTLCPETDAKTIKGHLLAAKKYGFNFSRPCVVMQPEQYLDAADEAGMLMQYDAGAALGFQRDVPEGVTYAEEEKNQFCIEQWESILKRTQNHPAVIMYAPGSELVPTMPVLPQLYRIAKQKDPMRLIESWTQDLKSWDVYEDYVGLSEPMEASENLHLALKIKPEVAHLPYTLHEYSGCETLEPYIATVSLSSRKIDTKAVAEKQGLGAHFPQLQANSRQIAIAARKVILEEGRKHPGFAGYKMWLIQDIPGYHQGIFDFDWQPKDYVPEKFLQCNGESILLMQELSGTTKRCFWGKEETKFEFTIAYWGVEAIKNGKLSWQIVDKKNRVLVKGGESLTVGIEPGNVVKLSTVTITMPEVEKACVCSLQVKLEDTRQPLRNSWRIWLFPDRKWVPPAAEIALYADEENNLRLVKIAKVLPQAVRFPGKADLLIANKLDEKVMAYLQSGGKVIFLRPIIPRYFFVMETVLTSFFSRWPCSAHGHDINATIINNHPALREFPHDGFCDYQFFHLLVRPRETPTWHGGRSAAFYLDQFSARVEPIIRVFSSKGNAAYLFEAKVGAGKLLATTLQFEEMVGQFPEATYLFQSLVDYALSAEFKPQAEVAAGELSGSWLDLTKCEVTGSSPAAADHPYRHFVDNDLVTYAEGSEGKQWIQVDLGEVKRIDRIMLWQGLDGRRCHDNKLAVSPTGAFAGEETVIFDSAKAGEYANGPDGKTFSFAPCEARYIRNYINGFSKPGTVTIHSQTNQWAAIRVRECKK